MVSKSHVLDREQRRLRWLLLGFWLLLLVPTLLLGYQTYQQLRYESLHQYRLLAENLSETIAATITSAVAVEEARQPLEYQYANQGQVSALAALGATSALAGVVGYFQGGCRRPNVIAAAASWGARCRFRNCRRGAAAIALSGAAIRSAA